MSLTVHFASYLPAIILFVGILFSLLWLTGRARLWAVGVGATIIVADAIYCVRRDIPPFPRADGDGFGLLFGLGVAASFYLLAEPGLRRRRRG